MDGNFAKKQKNLEMGEKWWKGTKNRLKKRAKWETVDKIKSWCYDGGVTKL